MRTICQQILMLSLNLQYNNTKEVLDNLNLHTVPKIEKTTPKYYDGIFRNHMT